MTKKKRTGMGLIFPPQPVLATCSRQPQDTIVRANYSHIAPHYPAAMAAQDYAAPRALIMFIMAAVARDVLKPLISAMPCVVFDFGVAAGAASQALMASHLVNKHAAYIGFDYAPGMVSAHTAANQAVGITTVLADCRDRSTFGSFKDTSADIILACGITDTMTIEDIKRMVVQATSCLNPGGILAMTIPGLLMPGIQDKLNRLGQDGFLPKLPCLRPTAIRDAIADCPDIKLIAESPPYSAYRFDHVTVKKAFAAAYDISVSSVHTATSIPLAIQTLNVYGLPTHSSISYISLIYQRN